ncbi:olfactory receptor 5V1-like [Rhinatrema bivittatum]|uniref:olfactory receptor 5V1-like n=1 Tax=Rhinatrema bivittatum TaxID=194408 RepID=UPI001128FA62|nr:olfactory receptor 5V1-like [Rhinatrema bivittatum]
MEMQNQTSFTEFIILGFSDFPKLQTLIGLIVFIFYSLNIMGNLSMFLIICLDSHLHHPMYFFLSNLSFLDLCYTTSTLYKILDIVIRGNNSITFPACMMQLYLFICCGCTEFNLLSAMAYDRYVAICNPLRYTLIMNKRVCILLAASSWKISFLRSVMYTVLTSQLSFFESREINHFFCDLTALLKLSCSDTSTVENVLLIESSFLTVIPFLLTLTSYVYIVSTILRIHSAEGRRKAFSTCSAHLIVIILFYGTIISLYMRPKSMYSLNQDKLFALLYTAVIPMLNPIIYSLKNKKVKEAIQRQLGRKRLPY